LLLLSRGILGNQEYERAGDIKNFANRQAFNGLIMEKTVVSGKATSPVFRFLKAASGKDHISW
jgi:glutathione peroxidase-family protein